MTLPPYPFFWTTPQFGPSASIFLVGFSIRNLLLTYILTTKCLLDERYAAVPDMLSIVFKLAASHCISKDGSMDSLCVHPQMVWMFVELATSSSRYFYWVDIDVSKIHNRKSKQDIGDRYISIFNFVADHLNEERSNSTSKPQEDTPGVLFYLTSIFIRELLDGPKVQEVLRDKDSNFGQELASLIEALLRYRTWAATKSPGWKNDAIAIRFKNECNKLSTQETFSDDWWRYIVEAGNNFGMKGFERGSSISRHSLQC
jgi:hypothetical protein